MKCLPVFAVLALLASACGAAKVDASSAAADAGANSAATPSFLAGVDAAYPDYAPVKPTRVRRPFDCWDGPDVTGPFEGADLARDPRCRVTPREENVLRDELPKLEARLASTANGDPLRASLLIALMDGYIELWRRQGRGTEAANASLRSAIDDADRVIQEFPGDAKIEDVRYYRAFALHRTQQTAAARKAYAEYMQLYPSSPRSPCVRLMVGETWLTDGINDRSKYRLARKEFEACVKIPAKENACFPYAEYYLAVLVETPEAPAPAPRTGGHSSSSSGSL